MTAIAIVECCQRVRKPSTMLVSSNEEGTKGNGIGGRENAKHFAVLTQLRMVRFCKYLGLRQRPIQFL